MMVEDDLPDFYHPFPDPQETFIRGNYRRIVTADLDLPACKPPPSPTHARLWLSRLPPTVARMLTTDLQRSFFTPIHRYISNSRQQSVSLPRPQIHCSTPEYIKLLDAADQAGMLYWSIMPQRFTLQDPHENAFQPTLFAMSKSATRSRLISWPRIPNQVIPDPPHTSLPDPCLFDAINTTHHELSGFYLDIHNMFHNITLTPALAKLFPFRPIAIKQLPATLRQRLQSRLALNDLSPLTMLRPYQATMPMGFKWSVYIAHAFATSCLTQAFALFKASSLAPPNLSGQFAREHAPFHLTKQSPLLLHIIDDIAVIVADWPATSVIAWNKVIRRIFHLNKLPVSDKKSCPSHHVETQALTFVGCSWDLISNQIGPDTAKMDSTAAQIKFLLQLDTIPTQKWERILGKLIWFALLNRPLLACTQRVFRLPPPIAESVTTSRRLPASTKRELLMLTALLPLATVSPSLPLFTTLIAFDASLQAGAVTYAKISLTLASQIWTQAKRAQFTNSTQLLLAPPSAEPDAYNPDDFRHITSLTWINAFSHRWKKENDHINDLEATTAVLALEWAIRSGASTNRLTPITDSMVVKGFLQKGRSSSPPLLLRSRRFAALALAHQLRPALLYLPSKLNPPDRYTRFKTYAHTTKL